MGEIVKLGEMAYGIWGKWLLGEMAFRGNGILTHLSQDVQEGDTLLLRFKYFAFLDLNQQVTLLSL